jgi:hypothetical protein
MKKNEEAFSCWQEAGIEKCLQTHLKKRILSASAGQCYAESGSVRIAGQEC